MNNSFNIKVMLRKFLSFSIGNWLGLLVALFSTPVVTRLLHPNDFGIYSMYTVLLNLFLIVCMLGTDQSFVRFFYDQNEKGRIILLRNCLILSCAGLAVVALLIMIFPNYLSKHLFGVLDSHLIVLLVLGVFISIINRFVLLIIRMQQKGTLYSMLQVAVKILDLCLLLSIIALNFNFRLYTAPILSLFIANILITLIGVMYTKNYWFNKISYSQKEIGFKAIIRYGFPLSLTLVITWVFQFIDRFFIKEWSTLLELGLYAAAFKIISILNIIQQSFTTFWVPVSLEKFKNDSKNTDFFKKIFELVSAVMVLIAVFTIMFKKAIILLLGEEYAEASSIFPFLIFIPIMYTISEVTVVGITFYKKTNWHIVISLLVCVFNIIGNIMLVPYLGAKGAAIATGVSYILFFYLRTFISNKYFKPKYAINKISMYILLLVLYATYSTFSEWSILDTIFGILIILLIFIKERKLFISFIKK